MFNIFKQDHGPIALDIGSEFIRMLQFRRTGSDAELVAHDEWQFPDAIGNDVAARRNATSSMFVKRSVKAGSLAVMW